MARPRLAIAAIASVIIALSALLLWHSRKHVSTSEPSSSARALDSASTTSAPTTNELGPTLVYAHNLLLRKGSDFRIYVRWIRGQMVRTSPQVNPSFDDPESFVLQIEKGIIRANIGDISNYLNASLPPKSPLKNISIEPASDRLKLHGTLHKMISLPVELVGTVSPTEDGRIRFHVEKLNVLKIPMKGLFGGLHIELSDLVSAEIPGVQITGNDIIFDTLKLLPPPHIHGQLTAVKVSVPDIEVIYGSASNDETQLAKWHNFLQLSGGTLDFGKLTMHHVDLKMIDASQDPWFDLDLVNYQAQLVNGYTRMTAQAGLEIFMPDFDEGAPKKVSQGITLEWLKDRNRSLPADIPVR